MLKSGDVILAKIQFVDTFQVKIRPALILYTEHNNIIVAGITSNSGMKGIAIRKKDGVIKDSVIKTNYVFTISEDMIEKKLFRLNEEKRKEVYEALQQSIKQLL